MIGSRLGKWLIDKELGHGGMGTVYLAHEEATSEAGDSRQAAVKVLSAELAREAGFLDRFRREIEILSRLEHPNIVHFYESGVQDGHHYYMMEYVAGPTFEEVIETRGRLPWREVLDVGLQVCAALKHAHNHGIIHRDLKPSNLLRSESGVVKLSDFGIAKLFASRQLTATGALVGTAEFLSPEQASGKPVTYRSDLYSLGVVLYALLTGRAPFQGKNILDLIHKHRYAQFDRPQRVVPDLPPALDEVVCNLLEKEPDKRPASALMLQRRFETIRFQLERTEQRTVMAAKIDETQVENADPGAQGDESPGPATLMSRLMREELARQQEGGVFARSLNRPWVLVTLFLLCAGILVWKFWPQSRADAHELFDRGAALMESNDPGDWVKGWTEYLEPLERKNPAPPHPEQMANYRRQYQEYVALQKALMGVSTRRRDEKRSTPTSEAQRFYQKGLRLCQEGDLVRAQVTWQNVVRSFGDEEESWCWVLLCQYGLTRLKDRVPDADARRESVRQAVERARRLVQQAKPNEAKEVLDATDELYRDDPLVKDEVEEVRRARRAIKD